MAYPIRRNSKGTFDIYKNGKVIKTKRDYPSAQQFANTQSVGDYFDGVAKIFFGAK